MRLDDCFELGHIQKPHGLKGEVSIFLDSDFPEYYEEMGSVFVLQGTGLVPFFIEYLQLGNDSRAIVKFEEIDTVDDAKALQSSKLYLPLDALPELEDDQFYFHEIAGYTVEDIALGEIGEVTQVYAAGPQELLAVDYKGTEVLIPIQDEIVLELNKKEGRIIVSLPEGLLDIYTEES
jgi:16S rRNA processing protein RimM